MMSKRLFRKLGDLIFDVSTLYYRRLGLQASVAILVMSFLTMICIVGGSMVSFYIDNQHNDKDWLMISFALLIIVRVGVSLLVALSQALSVFWKSLPEGDDSKQKNDEKTYLRLSDGDVLEVIDEEPPLEEKIKRNG